MRCMLQSVKALLCTVLLHARMGLMIQCFQQPQSKSQYVHAPHFEFLKLWVWSKSFRFMPAFNIRWDHRALQFHFIFTFELNIFVTRSTGVLWSSLHFPTVVNSRVSTPFHRLHFILIYFSAGVIHNDWWVNYSLYFLWSIDPLTLWSS